MRRFYPSLKPDHWIWLFLFLAFSRCFCSSFCWFRCFCSLLLLFFLCHSLLTSSWRNTILPIIWYFEAIQQAVQGLLQFSYRIEHLKPLADFIDWYMLDLLLVIQSIIFCNFNIYKTTVLSPFLLFKLVLSLKWV